MNKGDFIVLKDEVSIQSSIDNGDGPNPLTFEIDNVEKYFGDGVNTFNLAQVGEEHFVCHDRLSDEFAFLSCEEKPSGTVEELIENGESWLFNHASSEPVSSITMEDGDVFYTFSTMSGHRLDDNVFFYMKKYKESEHSKYFLLVIQTGGIDEDGNKIPGGPLTRVFDGEILSNNDIEFLGE